MKITEETKEQIAMDWLSCQLGTTEEIEKHLENFHSMLLLVAMENFQDKEKDSIISTYIKLRSLVLESLEFKKNPHNLG